MIPRTKYYAMPYNAFGLRRTVVQNLMNQLRAARNRGALLYAPRTLQ
jgi:hypothetical protein